mgnify:CR=1 FL=1
MKRTQSSVRSAQVISVIQTKSVEGTGTEDDPNRIVTQYWDADGTLLAVNDPFIQDVLLPSLSPPVQ